MEAVVVLAAIGVSILSLALVQRVWRRFHRPPAVFTAVASAAVGILIATALSIWLDHSALSRPWYADPVAGPGTVRGYSFRVVGMHPIIYHSPENLVGGPFLQGQPIEVIASLVGPTTRGRVCGIQRNQIALRIITDEYVVQGPAPDDLANGKCIFGWRAVLTPKSAGQISALFSFHARLPGDATPLNITLPLNASIQRVLWNDLTPNSGLTSTLNVIIQSSIAAFATILVPLITVLRASKRTDQDPPDDVDTMQPDGINAPLTEHPAAGPAPA